MTRATAATAFFTPLERVPDWAALTPMPAIHAVQNIDDPERYTPDYLASLDIVTYLNDHPTPAPAPAPAACTLTSIGPFFNVPDIIASEVAANLSELTGGTSGAPLDTQQRCSPCRSLRSAESQYATDGPHLGNYGAILDGQRTGLQQSGSTVCRRPGAAPDCRTASPALGDVPPPEKMTARAVQHSAGERTF